MVVGHPLFSVLKKGIVHTLLSPVPSRAGGLFKLDSGLFLLFFLLSYVCASGGVGAGVRSLGRECADTHSHCFHKPCRYLGALVGCFLVWLFSPLRQLKLCSFVCDSVFRAPEKDY